MSPWDIPLPDRCDLFAGPGCGAEIPTPIGGWIRCGTRVGGAETYIVHEPANHRANGDANQPTGRRIEELPRALGSARLFGWGRLDRIEAIDAPTEYLN